jgi:ferritin-like metal-binding protein YciE
MAIKDKKEIFVWLLSNVTQGVERSSKIFEEFDQVAEDPQLKEIMQARAFVSEKVLSTLKQCFKTLGVQPVQTGDRFNEIFLEDFRKEFKEIQSPEAKRLFVLSKLSRLIHFRIGELVTLVAAADISGNYGVGLLLETALADKLAMAERTRRFIRHIAEEKVAERRAA